MSYLAICIQSGEDLFSGYTISIDRLKINGKVRQLSDIPYTLSDNGHNTICTIYAPGLDSFGVNGDCRTPGDVTGSNLCIDGAALGKIKQSQLNSAIKHQTVQPPFWGQWCKPGI